MTEKKKSFIMYCDYLDTVEDLTLEERGTLFTALMRYANDEQPDITDRTVKIVFDIIRRQLDRDQEKYQKTVNQRNAALAKAKEKRNEKMDLDVEMPAAEMETAQTNQADRQRGETTGSDRKNARYDPMTDRSVPTADRSVPTADRPVPTADRPVSDNVTVNDTVNVNENVTDTDSVSVTENVTLPAKAKRAADTHTPKKHRFEDYVYLTDEEHRKLIAEFGADAVKRMIRIVSDYKGAHLQQYENKPYNDYYAIRDWGYDRYQKEQSRASPKMQSAVKPSYDIDDLEAFWNSR